MLASIIHFPFFKIGAIQGQTVYLSSPEWKIYMAPKAGVTLSKVMNNYQLMPVDATINFVS